MPSSHHRKSEMILHLKQILRACLTALRASAAIPAVAFLGTLASVASLGGLLQAQSFTFRLENDMPVGDGGYTQGFRYDLALPGTEPVWFKPFRSPLITWLNRSCTSGASCWQSQSRWSIGQAMFTPADIVSLAPIPYDHPFAGWLYVSSMLTLSQHDLGKSDIQLTGGLDLGVAVPSSLAGAAQTWWHTNFHRRPPNGWRNGVPDRVGFIITGDVARSIPTLIDGPIRFAGQVHSGFQVGNIVNSVRVGLPLRFGFNPPSNAPSPIINSTFVGMAPRHESGRGAIYLSAVVEAELKAYDYPVDGSRLTDVTASHAMIDLGIGIAGRLGPFEAGLHTVVRSPEFRPTGTWQSYNTASLTLIL